MLNFIILIEYVKLRRKRVGENGGGGLGVRGRRVFRGFVWLVL